MFASGSFSGTGIFAVLLEIDSTPLKAMPKYKTDADWERWGSKDPYFAVVTHQQFRGADISEKAQNEFFETGKKHVDHVIAICAAKFGAVPELNAVLDFGCGTGRLLVPFARVAKSVVGVDVSNAMLALAKENCRKRSINNVSLIQTADISGMGGELFDLVHSFVVLQHISPSRGERIFENLASRLRPGGIGVLHILYSKKMFDRWKGGIPLWWKPVAASWRFVKRIRFALNKNTDPVMEMNPYDLNRIFFILQKLGFINCYVEFTEHGTELGVLVFFKKNVSK